MLTGNDGSRDGEQRRGPRAGLHNQKLQAFLDNYKKGRNERNISHLQSVRFFREPRILVFSIRRENGEFLPDFDHPSRRGYFVKVERSLRPNSLVFLDPDTGIEPRSRPSERHVLRREISHLYSAMVASSALMIYQHIPRVQRPPFFHGALQRIVQERHPPPLYISDNNIVFFFLSKEPGVSQELSGLLRAYASEYQAIFAGLEPGVSSEV